MPGEWHEVEDWLRPGKDPDGRPSAVLGYAGRDSIYMFSDAWPTSVPGRYFEQGRTYTKFGFYTAWRFGDLSADSFARARRELIDMGYADMIEDRPKALELPRGQQEQPQELADGFLRAKLLRGVEIERMEPLTPLVEGLLDLDTLAVLYGPYGSGKSFVALDLAGHIVTGQQWHGLDVRQGPVLYIVGEGVAGMRSRWRAWADRFNGGADTLDLVWLPYPAQLGNRDHAAELVAIVRELRPAAVFIDTFSRSLGPIDENSTAAMAEIIGTLDAMRMADPGGHNPCVIPVHHTGWDKTRMRGAVVLPAAASTVIRVEKDERFITVTHEKAKDTEPIEPICFEMVGEPTPTLAKVNGRRAGKVSTEVRLLTMLKALQLGDLGDGLSRSDWRDAAAFLEVDRGEFLVLARQLKDMALIQLTGAKVKITGRGIEAVGRGMLPSFIELGGE